MFREIDRNQRKMFSFFVVLIRISKIENDQFCCFCFSRNYKLTVSQKRWIFFFIKTKCLSIYILFVVKIWKKLVSRTLSVYTQISNWLTEKGARANSFSLLTILPSCGQHCYLFYLLIFVYAAVCCCCCGGWVVW